MQAIPVQPSTLDIRFPPQPTADFVSRFSEIQYEWRRDNGVYCLELLNALLDDYPWAKEASDLYGTIMAKLRHIQSPVAGARLHEWMGQMQAAKSEPMRINEGVQRFQLMSQAIREFLARHKLGRGKTAKVIKAVYPKGVPQWATIVDVGGHHGEMGAHWIGFPGALQCFSLDLSISMSTSGRIYYQDDRLHHVCAEGGRLPFDDRSVEILVLSGILEHVLRPQVLLDEGERVLRQGGLMLVQVPYGGMEIVNPDASPLSFRSHVGTVNPYALTPKPLIFAAYVSYGQHFAHRWSWEGEIGDFIVCWQK